MSTQNRPPKERPVTGQVVLSRAEGDPTHLAPLQDLSDEAEEPERRRERLLRPRSLVIGALLIVLDALWVIQAEKVGYGPYFTTISLFANVLFILTGLIAVNFALRRWLPRAALTQAELLLIYTMLGFGAALAGHDMLPIIIQMMGHPFRFGNAANGWLDNFGQFLPVGLVVSDTVALEGYYQGHSSLYRPENWTAWLGPVLRWTGFTILLCWTMMCLNVLVRKAWQDRERLPFPIVEIPLQMTDPSGALWKSRLFWIGFTLCALLELINGLNWLYPSIPALNVKHVDIHSLGWLNDWPWRATGWTPYSLYPFVVGLGYLLPLDLLFSCWFFYLFWKAQLVITAANSWNTVPEFPFTKEQSIGGYAAILAFLLYNGRNYFREVWKKIWGEPSDIDDREEALSYRLAFAGALAGFVLLVVFMVMAGMSPLLAVLSFLIYFALSLAVTRIRAELGPPVHDLHFSGPDNILTRSMGTPNISDRDLTMLNYFFWFNRAYRSHPMPFGIEGLKVAKDTRASQSVMFWAVMLAAVVGTLAAFWAFLHLAYIYGTQAKFGQGSGMANEAFNRLNGWIKTPTPPNAYANGAMGVGFIFCSLLMMARIKFPWWPFHPIGYAISSTYSMNLVWMPLLIAWVIKGLIMRYGGVRLYRSAMPFFLGLLLGQTLMGCTWHLLGLWLDIVPYSFWGG